MVKLIAYYLPQFHEFAENNQWWGKGFTEWTCVKRANPISPDHHIKKPHPDIGYYCLEDKWIRQLQGDMAKKYGVYGFCYYHYWFGGTVLMQKTLEMMLEDGLPDHPFCFSWANEPWTCKMNGGDGETIQPANYGEEEEWLAHFNYLLRFFKRKNYILVDNKPLMVIYRVSQIPQYQERFQFWNEEARKHGFDGVHIVMTIGNFHYDDYTPMLPHVDACVEFYPNWLGKQEMITQWKNNVAHYDMDQTYQHILQQKKIHDVQYRGMMVGFDSWPRSGVKSNIFFNGSPEKYGHALRKQIARSDSEFIFINAWNEWGEGCALEPEEKYGYKYLEETKTALTASIFI